MKIIMSLIVATLLLLTSTIAIASEPAFHKFQKDEYGLLTAEDQRTFDQEHARAQSKGFIEVSFNVRHHGETRSDDQMERIEQGRRYAQTKKAILKGLKREIVYLPNDSSPTRAVRFLTVTPAGLLKILNDDRISFFVIYRRSVFHTQGTQTTESIVDGLGVNVALAHDNDGSSLTAVMIDTAFQLQQMPVPENVDDSKSACFSKEDVNPLLGRNIKSTCPLDGGGNPQETAVGPGTAENDTIPTSNEKIISEKYHGRLNAELLQKSAQGVNVILVKVGHVDNSATSCQSNNVPAPCHLIANNQLLSSLEYVVELINNGQQIDAVSMSVSGGGIHSNDSQCQAAPPDPAFNDALQEIHDSGARIFAPTGNEFAGQNGNPEGVNWPACLTFVEAVGAVSDINGVLASYSNFDSDIKTLYGIGAKNVTGETITATFDDIFFVEYAGTSFAVPTVVGQFLTLLSRDPTIPPDEILNTLRKTGGTVNNKPLHKFPSFTKAYNAIDSIATNTTTTENPPEFVLCSGPYNTPSFLISWLGNSQLPLVGVEFQKSTNGSTWTTYNESLAACVGFSGNNYYHRTRFETIFGYSNWSNVVFAYHNCGGGAPQ